MSSLLYNSFLLDMAGGLININVDQFGVMLVTSEYEPDKRTHARRSDVMAFEAEGAGYRQGGVVCDVAVDVNEDNALIISLGPSRWTKASISARYAVYFKRHGGEPDQDELVAVIDFGQDVTSTNGTFATSESILRLQN